MSILYTVKYRLKNQRFFRTVKNVKGDLIPKSSSENPVRVLFINDDSVIEVPVNGTTFKFSRERFLAQREKMSQDAGQQIITK